LGLPLDRCSTGLVSRRIGALAEMTSHEMGLERFALHLAHFQKSVVIPAKARGPGREPGTIYL
jgi:hypothetical protein